MRWGRSKTYVLKFGRKTSHEIASWSSKCRREDSRKYRDRLNKYHPFRNDPCTANLFILIVVFGRTLQASILISILDIVNPLLRKLFYLLRHLRPLSELSSLLSVCGSTALCWSSAIFFSFLILYIVGRTAWTGNQPVARTLPTHRTTKTQNKRIQTSVPSVGFEPMIPAFERAKTGSCLRPCGHCGRLSSLRFWLF
jgi:hypothetical protein